MGFEWFVSGRYLRARRKQVFIWVTTGLSVLGVGAAVFLLIVTHSVMTGFGERIIQGWMAFNSHVRLREVGLEMHDWPAVKAQVQKVRGVAAGGMSPYIFQMVIANQSGRWQPVQLWGIDPRTHPRVSRIADHLQAGKLSDLTKPSADGLPQVLIGLDLAKWLLGEQCCVSWSEIVGRFGRKRALATVGAERYVSRAAAVRRVGADQATKWFGPACRIKLADLAKKIGSERADRLFGASSCVPMQVLSVKFRLNWAVARNYFRRDCDVGVQTCYYMGRMITLVAPFADQTPMGDPFPKTGRFRIAGVFASGDFVFNKSGVFMSLADAQRFLDLGKSRDAQGRDVGNVSGLMIRVTRPNDAEAVARRIETRLRDARTKVPGTYYQAWDWQSLAPGLFAALKLERLLMFVLMAVGVLVGSINIISTLIMVVMEKTKDIAIMRSMGATRAHVIKIFVYQGLTIGLLGTGLGLAGGLFSCWLLKNYEFIRLPEIYGMNKVPILVSPTAVTVIAALSIALSLVATIYPAWKASRLDPAEAVRYE